MYTLLAHVGVDVLVHMVVSTGWNKVHVVERASVRWHVAYMFCAAIARSRGHRLRDLYVLSDAVLARLDGLFEQRQAVLWGVMAHAL